MWNTSSPARNRPFCPHFPKNRTGAVYVATLPFTPRLQRLCGNPDTLRRRRWQIAAQGFLPWVGKSTTGFQTPQVLANATMANSFRVNHVINRLNPRVGNPGLKFGNAFGVRVRVFTQSLKLGAHELQRMFP